MEDESSPEKVREYTKVQRKKKERELATVLFVIITAAIVFMNQD